MTAKTKKDYRVVLFKDPTLQGTYDVPSVVRYVSIEGGTNGLRKARREFRAALRKTHPTVEVSVYDFKEPYEYVDALVWPTRPYPVCLVLPERNLPRVPYLLERVRGLVEGTVKDFGTKRKVVLDDHGYVDHFLQVGETFDLYPDDDPSKPSVVPLGSYDSRIWAGLCEAKEFAADKQCVAAYLFAQLCVRRDGTHPHPELRTIRVPCAYPYPAKFGYSKQLYLYRQPMPYTVFLCGHRLQDPESGVTDMWSPHDPNEAVFLNDKREWHIYG